MGKTADNIQILNANKDKIKDNPVGFEEVKAGKGKQFIKKTAENISKMALAVVIYLMNIPALKLAIDTWSDLKGNDLIAKVADICVKFNLTEITDANELFRLMATSGSEYTWIATLVHGAINWAVENPHLVYAGGVVLTSALVTGCAALIKLVVRQIKGAYENKKRIGNANEMQLNIYNLVKAILKHKNFKRAKNPGAFKKTLEEAVIKVGQAAQYPYELMQLYTCLQDIYGLVDRNEIKDYSQAIINVQANIKRIEAKSYADHEENLASGRTR